MKPATDLDLELIARLEAHSVIAWPASVCERTDDGWVLRATPGLERGRSNHGLPPSRELSRVELDLPIARVEAFAALHGIQPGIQVSPLELHGDLLDELDARGWRAQGRVLVMAADAGAVATGGEELELVLEGHATEAWRAAWAMCEPGRDLDAHVNTVFRLLEGRACFARIGMDAVGVVVDSEQLAGLFCLAVAPAARRRGLGRALVRRLLARCAPDTVAYLQVERRNAPAVAMYEGLGFETLYTYRHCIKAGLVAS